MKIEHRLGDAYSELERLRNVLARTAEQKTQRLRELAGNPTSPSVAFVIDQGHLVIFDTETLEVFFDAVPTGMYTLGTFPRSSFGRLRTREGSQVFFVNGVVNYKT